MLEKLKELIRGVMPEVNLDGVNEETKLFDDLHFDSLGIMMLAMAIEDEFGFQFDGAISFVTIGDVMKYIDSHKK